MEVSSSDEHKQNITTGYPSMDHANMYPPQQPAPSSAGVIYPVSCGPKGYAPHPYAPNYSYPYPNMNHDPPNYLSHPTSQNPYTAQPYNDFYYPQQHYKQLSPTKSGNSSSFFRVMVVLMFVLVASMSTMTLVIWFLFGTYIPEFEIISVGVSNFTVTELGMTGTWDVATKVSNPNKDLTIRFENMISSVLYKEETLGVSAVNPFDVPQMQTTGLNLTISAMQGAGGYRAGTLQTLRRDYGNRMVAFNLRLSMSVSFTAPGTVYRQENVGVLCENMQVMFSKGTGEGMMSPGLQVICLINLNEGLKEN